jgi:hypothetical protein
MSIAANAEAGIGGSVCDNCGIAEGDEIKVLEERTVCHSARYCGDKSRITQEECRKRKDEIHDKKLFTQPDETHLGECPICFLPMPLDPQKSFFRTCCSEIICQGCLYANAKSNIHDKAKAGSCPFCREPWPKKKGEFRKRLMKRVKANDPAALCHMGGKCYTEGDLDGGFEYMTKAAELGNADAHHNLGFMYYEGEGVEKDEEKAIYHFEKAAIGGHPDARNNLACIERKNGNMERSVKHFIIAANLGNETSMKQLWTHYSEGNITKEDLEATLRTHKTAIDEMKSPQRDAAEAAAFFG